MPLKPLEKADVSKHIPFLTHCFLVKSIDITHIFPVNFNTTTQHAKISCCLCVGAASRRGGVCVATRGCRTAACRNGLLHYSAAW